jgi:septal ring factor EnvC (AmiA/AmiB activator)
MRPSRGHDRDLLGASARVGLLGASLALQAAALTAPAQAQAPDPAATRAKLEKNRVLLKENRERVGTIKTDLERLAKERDKLDQDLIETSKSIQAAESKMTTIEDRLGGLEEREATLQTSLRRQRHSIAALLAAIQRMGRNPPPVLITRRQDALKMVRSAMLLARAFPQLKSRATRLSVQLKELVAVIDGIKTERDQLRAESRRLTDAQKRLSYLMQTKRQSLSIRRLELAEVQRTVRQIGDNVSNLEQLIAKLGPATEKLTAAPPVPNARPAMPASGAGGEETRVAMKLPRPSIAPSGERAPQTPKVAFNLEPSGGTFVAARPIAPAIPFHRAKGQLPLPAAGQIEQEFGTPTKYGDRAKGILIKTRYGAQITSPCDGSVMFAGKFRTYGQLLIIKAGDGYHVLLAGLSRIDVLPGQFVLKSEPVGTMRKSPGKRAGPDSPRLYVEFRKDGRPINPRPWWSASSTGKVQG